MTDIPLHEQTPESRVDVPTSDTPEAAREDDRDAVPAPDAAPLAAPAVARDAGQDDEEGADVEAPPKESAAERLDAEADLAADYLEELLNIADMDGDIDIFVEGGRAHVSIVTDTDQLVGKNGEVLDALQELARLVVMTETGHRSRLMLDIAGHRERRRIELTGLAKEAIAEVKETGEQVRMAPMNPFERKIVHDIVASEGLVSESEGVEPNRRVIILP